MAHNKKRITQISAIIALFAIVISIVWSWILVLLSSWKDANAPTFDVNEFMKSYSWNIDASTGTTLPLEVGTGSDVDEK